MELKLNNIPVEDTYCEAFDGEAIGLTHPRAACVPPGLSCSADTNN